MFANLNTLVNNSPDLAILVDMQGKILTANKNVYEQLGYSPSDIANINITDLFQEKDLINEHSQNAKQGISGKLKANMINSQKEYLKTKIKYIPFYENSEHNILVLLIIEIYNNPVAEDLEKKLLQVVQSSKEIVCIFSIDGTINYVSASCKNTSGYQTEEIIGTNHQQYIHPKEYTKLRNRLLNQLLKKKHVTYTYQFKHKEGHYIWKESTFQGVFHPETNALSEIIAISREVTERKRYEKMIRENERRFRQLIEESLNGVFIYRDNRIIFVNKTGVKLLGASSKSQLIDQRISHFIFQNDSELLDQTMKLMGKGTKIPLHEEKWVRFDGVEIDVEVVAYPTIYKGQDATQVFVTDITEKKRMREIAILSEKLNTVGQLAAGMAHEIRNPLTSLYGFLQLIRAGNYENRYFDIMQDELERIEFIVSQLLATSKPQIVQYKQREIKEIINEVIEFLGPQSILKNIAIVQSYGESPMLIRCDVNQIKQVFLNILKNGMEAMESDGEIQINIKRVDTKVHIEIIDQGSGIPEEYIEKIGQPFFTTKKNGTGLGLMVSMSIIKNHDGQINVRSKERLGTTFEIILPIHNEK